jgi:hypothetical protein
MARLGKMSGDYTARLVTNHIESNDSHYKFSVTSSINEPLVAIFLDNNFSLFQMLAKIQPFDSSIHKIPMFST